MDLFINHRRSLRGNLLSLNVQSVERREVRPRTDRMNDIVNGKHYYNPKK